MYAFILLQDYPTLVGIGTMEGDFKIIPTLPSLIPFSLEKAAPQGLLLCWPLSSLSQQLTFQESEGPKQFPFIATEESG